MKGMLHKCGQKNQACELLEGQLFKGLCNNYQEGGGGPKMIFTKGKIR